MRHYTKRLGIHSRAVHERAIFYAEYTKPHVARGKRVVPSCEQGGVRSESRQLACRTLATSRKRRLDRYSPAAVPSGIFKSSTKPTMNSTATERTPIELEPVNWVNTLTSNVPMMVAYLPKISKKP